LLFRGDVPSTKFRTTLHLEAIRTWLARFADKQTTFGNYRVEAARRLLWALVQLGKPLSSLTHEDCLRYQHFLAGPQPAATFVAGSGRKHPRDDVHWRPFYGPPPASARQAMVILNVLFSWLVQLRRNRPDRLTGDDRSTVVLVLCTLKYCFGESL
jgi:hypothetical protein